MADKKISELVSLTGANAATGDLLPIVDISATETKKITREEFFTSIPSIDVTGNIAVGGTVDGRDIAADGSIIDGLGTISTQDANSVNIDGGSIDGTVIGGSTPAAISGTTGQFGTSLNVDGTVTADGLTVDSGSGANQLTLARSTTYSGLSWSTLISDFGGGGSDLIFDSTGANTGYGFRTRDSGDVLGKALVMSPNRDISFYEDTGTTPKMVWKAADERLGIGTSSPARKLHVATAGNNYIVSHNTTASTSALLLGAENGSTAIYSWTTPSSGLGVPLRFVTGATESMRIDTSGNVGIGVTPSAWRSVTDAIQIGQSASISSNNNANAVSFTSNSYVNSSNNNIYISTGKATNYYQFDGAHVWQYAGSGSAGATVSYSEAMRIDSSGNLLVANTTGASTDTGHIFSPSGIAFHVRDGGIPLVVDRLTDHGDLQLFRKDGTTVGSIGVYNDGANSPYFADQGNVGIRLSQASTDDIVPCDTTGANRDAAINLGASGARWKDLYLSGGIEIENGTGNVGVGKQALNSNTASNNTAVGYQAGYSNTTGVQNLSAGVLSLYANTTGAENVAIGSGAVGVVVGALGSNTTGNYNTAIGNQALKSNTTADNNTAVGYQASYSNTTGIQNVSVGDKSLYTATTGNYNTSVGKSSLYFNTTGSSNTALGLSALQNNTTASYNTAVGYQAAYANTTGSQNTAVGMYSLYDNTSGNFNVALGLSALENNTTASSNTAVGYQAGYSNTTGTNNTFIGEQSGYWNATGSYNTALGSDGYAAAGTAASGSYNISIGTGALRTNDSGNYNTAVGASALYSNTTASNNTAVGYQALYSATTALDNTAVGFYAGYNVTTGNGRGTFIGKNAGFNTTTGTDNVCVGYTSGYTNQTGNANVYVGGGLFGAVLPAGYSATGSQNTFVGFSAGAAVTTGAKNTILGGFDGNQGGLDIRTSSNNIVLSDGDGNPRLQLNGSGYPFIFNMNPAAGTNTLKFNTATGEITYDTSSARYKNNIRDSVYGLSHVLQMQSRMFEYKKEGTTDIGLVAEELDPIIPELVGKNKDGQPDSVSYDRMVSVLVKAIQEQQAIITALEARITALESA